MKEKIFLLLLSLLLCSCSIYTSDKHQYPLRSSHLTAGCIREPKCHEVFTIAHRAEGLGAPENSREAMAKVVEDGIPMAELDLRFSKDHKIFISHDGTLKRETDSQGEIADKTSEELLHVHLKNGETLPTFEDIYAVTRGRVVLDLHFKDNAMREIAEYLDRSGSFDDVIFFAMNDEQKKTAAELKQKYPQMIVMPRFHKWKTIKETDKILRGNYEIAAIDYPLVHSAQLAYFHQHGMKVFCKSLIAERPLQYISLKFLLSTSVDGVLVNDPLFMMKLIGKE